MSTAKKVLDHLQSYDIKKVSEKHYRCKNPLRQNSDSGLSFSVTINDDEHGAWHDYVTKDAGSLYQLAGKLGLETPQPAATEKPAPAFDGLVDYAKYQGVESSVFEAAGWHETTRYSKRCLAIETKSGQRFRMLEGDNKYLNPSGYKACWYGLNARAMERVAKGQPLVFANGEASTVVGQHFGLAAFTVAGGGEKSIPAHLLSDLQKWLGEQSPVIYVALDCDTTGMKAAIQVRDQFRKLGYESHALDLNLWKKGDLANFCKIHEEASPIAIARLPHLTGDTVDEAAQKYQRWFIGDKFDLLKIPPIEWFIEPFIPKNMLGVLYGQSNIGKSFISLDFALTLAKDNPVLYLIAEGEQGYAQRVLAWEQHHKQRDSNIKYVFGAVHLMDNKDFEEFLLAVQKIKPAFLVVDTVKKTMVGFDTNSGRDVSIYLDRCEQIRKRVGCTVLLVHHTNKGGQQMTGSYNWMSDVDFVIKATEEDGLICLESDKDKNNQRFGGHYRRLISVEVAHQGQMVGSAVVVPAEKVIQTDQDPLTPNQEKVLSLLALTIYREGASRAEVAQDLTEMPSSTLTRTLSKLKDLKYIEQPKYGRYAISDLGKAKMGIKETQITQDAQDAQDAHLLTEGFSEQLQKPSEQLEQVSNFNFATSSTQDEINAGENEQPLLIDSPAKTERNDSYSGGL